MKARLLKKLLNNTGYNVAYYDTYIGIGSPLCHDLIKVTIPGFNVIYALDTFRQGRKALEQKSELLFIWDKLLELIQSGEINTILDGDDELENPLPVYTVTQGKFFASTTDAYGWPNVTKEGYMIYNNSHFDNPIDALNYGIEQLEYKEENSISALKDLNEKREIVKKRIRECYENRSELKQLLLTEMKKQQ
jgi:hypothetical protein